MKKTILAVSVFSMLFYHCSTGKLPVSTSKPGSEGSYIIHLAEGIRLLGDKKIDDAIAELQQATVLRPDSDKAYNFLGIGFFMNKNYPEASACFQKALTINPAYAAAICNLGNLQFETGEVDAAQATLRQGVAAFADDVPLNFSLGNILLNKGDLDQGFAYLKKVLELDPEYLEREKKFSLGKTMNNIPRPEMFFRYARLYAAAGNAEKMLQYFEHAKKAGFFEWERIRLDEAFAGFRDDPRVKAYLD
jgi:tetratricopeptide (TPR) repeat protein